MTKKYKILAKFIKDMSSETPDIDTYLFVKDNLENYSLQIDIKSKSLKDKILQVETKLAYCDKNENKKKSFFEMIYATVIRLSDDINKNDDLGKIILCDLQNEIYPELEKSFIQILHDSGYPNLKFNKKVDFEELYKKNKEAKI
tara:strand:+ start:19 stop:450 length:432 start_codon:yes stop_codon:yes gene_type:complete